MSRILRHKIFTSRFFQDFESSFRAWTGRPIRSPRRGRWRRHRPPKRWKRHHYSRPL